MLWDKTSHRHIEQQNSTRLGLVAYTLGAIAKTMRELCPELELDASLLEYDKESQGYVMMEWMWSRSHSTIRRSYRRRFFVTKPQIMGLGPVNIQEDDKICILFGCRVPVVLRLGGLIGYIPGRFMSMSICMARAWRS